MRKVITESATGLVVNIIEIEPDDSGGFSHWQCPDGHEMLDDGPDAAIGGTWNGSTFIRPIVELPPRLDVLMSDDPVDEQSPEDVAADKAELLELLHAKLADTGDLSWDEMNRMLALERES